MKFPAIATLLALGSAALPVLADKGRVVFVCEADNRATCELAAARFEARSRERGGLLDGRAAIVDELDADQLALAVLVVTIDASLYRHWLLSIRRLETWIGVPRADEDRAAAEEDLARRLSDLVAD